MQERSRVMVEDVIKSNRDGIKAKGAKVELENNPSMLTTDKAQDEESIRKLLIKLRAQYNELFPYVKKLKNYIADITEETHICAIYLLLCQVFNIWESFFILSEAGKSSSIGGLIRMIKEGDMQVQLFVTEASENSRVNLNKWFKGEIITHGEGRDKVSKFIEKGTPVSGDNLKDLSAHIYQMESQASHNAYTSILELVSPFTEDYDFEGYCGYYRTVIWLKYAFGSLEFTNITLKMVYLNIVKDQGAYKEINKILVKYNPIKYNS